MSNVFSNYVKKKKYLICVDSDGCAIDSMDVKHFNCFGPCMVDEWNLHAHKKEILDRWNVMNLYSLTRGINRFKGLDKALNEINEQYQKIEDLETLSNWVNTTKELSNDSLKREIELHPESISLKKALSWSNAVNENITKLPIESKRPYEGVLEALMKAHEYADIAIVSSANKAAVLEEWEYYGLINHVDIVLAQDAGTKAYCIQELVKKGYDKENVLMCGDALGDLKATESNGVFYYPIKVKHEKESWKEFIDVALDKLLTRKYKGEYQENKAKEFLENLNNSGK